MAPTCTLTGSKLAWGAKTTTKSKHRDLKRVVFFRGLKSQRLET